MHPYHNYKQNANVVSGKHTSYIFKYCGFVGTYIIIFSLL